MSELYGILKINGINIDDLFKTIIEIVDGQNNFHGCNWNEGNTIPTLLFNSSVTNTNLKFTTNKFVLSSKYVYSYDNGNTESKTWSDTLQNISFMVDSFTNKLTTSYSNINCSFIGDIELFNNYDIYRTSANIISYIDNKGSPDIFNKPFEYLSINSLSTYSKITNSQIKSLIIKIGAINSASTLSFPNLKYCLISGNNFTMNLNLPNIYTIHIYANVFNGLKEINTTTTMDYLFSVNSLKNCFWKWNGSLNPINMPYIKTLENCFTYYESCDTLFSFNNNDYGSFSNLLDIKNCFELVNNYSKIFIFPAEMYNSTFSNTYTTNNQTSTMTLSVSDFYNFPFNKHFNLYMPNVTRISNMCKYYMVTKSPLISPLTLETNILYMNGTLLGLMPVGYQSVIDKYSVSYGDTSRLKEYYVSEMALYLYGVLILNSNLINPNYNYSNIISQTSYWDNSYFQSSNVIINSSIEFITTLYSNFNIDNYWSTAPTSDLYHSSIYFNEITYIGSNTFDFKNKSIRLLSHIYLLNDVGSKYGSTYSFPILANTTNPKSFTVFKINIRDITEIYYSSRNSTSNSSYGSTSYTVVHSVYNVSTAACCIL